MKSQPDHDANLRQTIRERLAVIVAGTGVSIAASYDAKIKRSHPQASWSGLLENGLHWLKDHKLIDEDDADAQLKLLKKNPQTHRFVSAAEDVTEGMGTAKSKHFAKWLKVTVGSIKACDRSVLDALEALREHGNLLATTNYDGLLLDGNKKLSPAIWNNSNAIIGALRTRDTENIIFLHGYWRQPESVILDWKSYDQIARNEQYRDDLAAFWKTSIWVYVGCGINGLSDPDFGLLLERYSERARQANHWDYCLVREDQRDEFQGHFDTNELNIRAISFGKTHVELPEYLHSLLPSAAPRAPALSPVDGIASAARKQTTISPVPESPDAKDIFRFRNPAAEWYVARTEQALVSKELFSSGSRGSNLLITGRTGVGKSSFLAWLSNRANNEGCAVLHCVPSSDRVDDLLLQLARQETEFLGAHDIKAPETRGIPKLDHQEALGRLLQKTTKHLVVFIDQVERLFPYTAIGTGEIYNTWRMLMEALGNFKKHPHVTWVLAVKEWYFLLLYPSEVQLRIDNFTYISLSDLKGLESASLVRRLATLAEVKVGDQEIDLIVTKTGGRPLALVLCFLVARERSPQKNFIQYDYLSKTEPWNEIFAADFARLGSQRQRRVVLALAFSKSEVVPEDEIVQRVQKADRCTRSEVEEDIRRLDQDYGLLVKKEGFLSFVHSGFGVFLDNKCASHYPREWFAQSVEHLDDTRRKEFQLLESEALERSMAMFAHRTASMFAVSQTYLAHLRIVLEKKKWQKAKDICQQLEDALTRIYQQIRGFREYGSRIRRDPNANTVLLKAVKEARKRTLRSVEVPLDVSVVFAADSKTMRVPGEHEDIIGVYAALFENSVHYSNRKRPRISVKCFCDQSTRRLICDVIDNGVGVSPEIRKRLFQPFFTTSTRGAGLGLAIAARVIQAYGGTIREIGVAGHGATFRLEFPLFESK
jgi:signal transduction histidine kinase